MTARAGCAGRDEVERILDLLDDGCCAEHQVWVWGKGWGEQYVRAPDGGGWDPWAELASRHHLRLRWDELPAGMSALIADNGPSYDGKPLRTVLMDPRLPAGKRSVALTHELIHDERGVLLAEDAPKAKRDAEERLVRQETARRVARMRAPCGISSEQWAATRRRLLTKGDEGLDPIAA